MRILILNGSPRKNGNTELLAKAFAKGAEENNEVEIVNVAELNISPCRGCNYCCAAGDGKCAQKDDMTMIYERLMRTDMLVLASPVYFYGISAQLKTVIDRLHTPMRSSFPLSRLGLLLVGAAELPEMFDSILTQYRLALNFFKLEDVGMVLARGERERGSVEGSAAIEEAFALGRSIKQEEEK